MPATIPTATAGKKRKREDVQGSVDAQSAFLLLEEQILESRRNYNKIVTLLEHATKRDSHEEITQSTLASIALCRVFCKLIALGHLSSTRQAHKTETAIVQWLNERYMDYKEILLKFFSEDDANRQSTALALLMRLVKEDAEHLELSEESIWRKGTFARILKELIVSGNAAESRDEFVQSYTNKYDDIRFHTFGRLRSAIPVAPFTEGTLLTTIRAMAAEFTSEAASDNIISMLAAIDTAAENNNSLPQFFLRSQAKTRHELRSLSAHKRQAQEAWLTVLRHDLSEKQRKGVLSLMSHRIAPWFLKVELLMDFLTDSFNQGGATSLMALSGLFYLIQEKNLDYPHFYRKLYSLLDADVLHSKHRSRFFRLLDTFLASTHLPAALVASFLKKISRLSLNAPPSAIVVVVPWIYNLLKSHPTCTFMIHRSAEGQDGEDPFLEDEQDPMNTDAVESSLWEIYTLQDHYHPNVATIAKIISEQFTKQAYNLEDFLDHSYQSVSLQPT